MRICDKKGCDERQHDTINTTEQEYDLCKTHMNEFLEWVNKKPKKRGRPPKYLSTKKMI